MIVSARAIEGVSRMAKVRGIRIERAEGPAVETSLHVWDRPATDDNMRPLTGRLACTKWTPLESLYKKNKLGDGNPAYSADTRYRAGVAYEKLYRAAEPRGQDSTQALNVSRSHQGGNGSDAQIDAARKLADVDGRLGPRDRIIIRMVCGQTYFPSEAVALVSPDYAKSTIARFREALDSLVEVFDAIARGD